MFTIIGGDGKEYGPVTAEQIRVWMNAGRANLDTQAKLVGSSEWRRLGDYAEFSGAPTPPVMAAPPPPGAPFGGPSGPQGAELAADEATLAGHGARIGAAFINLAVYFFSMMPGAVMGARRMMEEFPEMRQGKFIPPDRIAQMDPGVLLQMAALVYGGVGIAILLQAVLIGFTGQSLGKLLVGVRVVRVDGAKAGFVRAALLRYLLPVFFFFMLLLIPFVGILLALAYLAVDLGFMFRADRRCLHDLVAGTIVVKK